MTHPPPGAAHDEFEITTDAARMDAATVHAFLQRSYWAAGIPLETVRRALAHSLVFGVFAGARQVGVARVVSDYATFAYVGDVFIDEAYRGRGLGKRLMQAIVAHPALQGLRRWMLLTGDAHGLYEQFGFRIAAHPERVMERHAADCYAAPRSEEQPGACE